MDGIAGGNASLGSVVAVPGAVAGDPVAQAQAAYVAPAQLPATREVTVSAVVRIGAKARNRVEVLARVLLLDGPVTATLTGDAVREPAGAGREPRQRGRRR